MITPGYILMSALLIVFTAISIAITWVCLKGMLKLVGYTRTKNDDDTA